MLVLFITDTPFARTVFPLLHENATLFCICLYTWRHRNTNHHVTSIPSIHNESTITMYTWMRDCCHSTVTTPPILRKYYYFNNKKNTRKTIQLLPVIPKLEHTKRNFLLKQTASRNNYNMQLSADTSAQICHGYIEL